jgi:hypothetical protein
MYLLVEMPPLALHLQQPTVFHRFISNRMESCLNLHPGPIYKKSSRYPKHRGGVRSVERDPWHYLANNERLPKTTAHKRGRKKKKDTMADQSTGIQELMAAETRASQIVAEARIGTLLMSFCRLSFVVCRPAAALIFLPSHGPLFSSLAYSTASSPRLFLRCHIVFGSPRQ